MMNTPIKRLITTISLSLALLIGSTAFCLAAGNETSQNQQATQADKSAQNQEIREGIPGIKKSNVIMVTHKDIKKYPDIGVGVKYVKKKKQLEIDRNNIHGILYMGKKTMLVNNEIKYTLPVAPRLITEKGKTYVVFPAKKVGKILGLNYKYDKTSKRVIYTPRKAKIKSLKNLQTKPFMLMSTEEFVEFLGPIARKDYHKSGMLASITIAQAIHESFAGCSLLAQKGNNLFGMKAYLSGNTWKGSTWKGKVFVKKTKEQYGRRVVTITDRFRKFDNVMQCVNDHSAYFINAKNGSHKRYAGINKTKSYKKQLKIIKKGGYCTFSDYTKNLERLIKKYKLTRFDK